MLTSFKDRIVATVDKATKEGKVYIFLTTSGGYFSSLIFILFIISLSYGNSLAYLCSFLFLSVTWVSCIVTNYNLYGLDYIRFEKDDFYIEGESVVGEILFKNIGKKSRFDIEASVLKANSNFVLEIAPGEAKKVEVLLPIKKRGVYPFKKLELRTTFPFGIFRSWKPFKQEGEIIVIPKPIASDFPKSSHYLDSDGEKRTKKLREEFHQHGRYSNEEASRIDWKVFARRDELYLKEYDSAKVNSYELDDSYDEGQISYWLLQAEKEGSLYSFKIANKFFPSGNGRAHLLSCLRELAKR